MPINNITQTISELPAPPHRGVDVRTFFVNKQEDFQDHLADTTIDELNTLKDQLNTRIEEINSTTTTMNGYADTASAGASTATTKAGEASTSASEALTSRNQANTFATNSSNSATKASQWADNNYNVEVEAGKYSAKHWATVAQSAGAGEDTKGTNIASASTTTIGTAGLGDYIHITGTTTITSFGTAANAGLRRTLIFDGALTITDGANLICPALTNIVTIANTIVSVIAETTTQWRVEYVIHPSVSFAELGYLDGVTSSIQSQLNAKAPLANPAFTGTPTAPTPTTGDNSTKVATTAYVDGKMVRATAVNSTSGTSIDFTGIPSWVKRITVMFDGVSTNGSSNIQIQIGGTGGIENTGYSSTASSVSSAVQSNGSTTGYIISGNNDSGNSHTGVFNLCLNSLNKWNATGIHTQTTIQTAYCAGSKTLSATLNRIRITTVNGTDSFDAGSINIMYEG